MSKATSVQPPPDATVRAAKVYAAAERARDFFVKQSDVHRTLARVTHILEQEKIPSALVGALALGEYGYERMTVDVNMLMTRDGLERFKAPYLGRGYLEKFPGSKGVRDTETGVAIDVVLTGDYPGDGLPKPVVFPDPKVVSSPEGGLSLLPLPMLIDLKLASGMSAPHRLKDLADVLELIRVAGLPLALHEQLNPWVQARYCELWRAAAAGDDE